MLHTALGEWCSSTSTLWVMSSLFCPFFPPWAMGNALITPPVEQTFGSACPAVHCFSYGYDPASYSLGLAFTLIHAHLNAHMLSENGLGSSLVEISITATRLYLLILCL